MYLPEEILVAFRSAGIVVLNKEAYRELKHDIEASVRANKMKAQYTGPEVMKMLSITTHGAFKKYRDNPACLLRLAPSSNGKALMFTARSVDAEIERINKH